MENKIPEYNNKTHVLTTIIQDNGKRLYEVTPLIEEIAILRSNEDSFKEISMAYIRAERNRLLKDSDWSILSDIPMTDLKRNEWITYRQQLRDFPDNCDITNPIFPVKPTGE